MFKADKTWQISKFWLPDIDSTFTIWLWTRVKACSSSELMPYFSQWSKPTLPLFETGDKMKDFLAPHLEFDIILLLQKDLCWETARTSRETRISILLFRWSQISFSSSRRVSHICRWSWIWLSGFWVRRWVWVFYSSVNTLNRY